MSDNIEDEDFDDVEECVWCEGSGRIEQPGGGYQQCPECDGKGIL